MKKVCFLEIFISTKLMEIWALVLNTLAHQSNVLLIVMDLRWYEIKAGCLLWKLWCFITGFFAAKLMAMYPFVFDASSGKPHGIFFRIDSSCDVPKTGYFFEEIMFFYYFSQINNVHAFSPKRVNFLRSSKIFIKLW